MEAIAWHIGLPKHFLQAGFSESSGSNVISTKMASGPFKRRKRSSIAYKPVRGSMNLTLAQADIFTEFYEGALNSGVVPVIIPIRNSVMTVFINSYILSPGKGMHWQLSLQMVRLG